jgi:hypothetical protein
MYCSFMVWDIMHKPQIGHSCQPAGKNTYFTATRRKVRSDMMMEFDALSDPMRPIRLSHTAAAAEATTARGNHKTATAGHKQVAACHCYLTKLC